MKRLLIACVVLTTTACKQEATLPRPLPEAERGDKEGRTLFLEEREGKRGFTSPSPLRGGGRGEGSSCPPLPAAKRGTGGGVGANGPKPGQRHAPDRGFFFPAP